MKPNPRRVETAAVIQRESREVLLEQARAALDEEVRVSTITWLKRMRDFFPRGRAQSWSLQHIRSSNLPVRASLEEFATELGETYMRVARAARRAAFARALLRSAELRKEVFGVETNKQHALSKVREATNEGGTTNENPDSNQDYS